MGFPANLMPGKDNWGQYRMPDGQLVNVSDVSEQIFYDSEILPAAITAGQEFTLCRNPAFSTTANKVFGIDYNLPQWNTVPMGWYFSVEQIGWYLQAGIPTQDLIAVVNSAYFEFMTGSQKTEASGLIAFYPLGVGIGGAVAMDGGGVAAEVSALNIGTPAPASIFKRKYTIELPSQTSYEIRLRFPTGLPGGGPLLAARQIYFAMRTVRFRPVV